MTYNSETHILTFSSTNAVPVGMYTYTNLIPRETGKPGASNNVVLFTADDLEAGQIDVTDYIFDNYVHAKISFEVVGYEDYGQATWYSDPNGISQFWVATGDDPGGDDDGEDE